MTLKNAMVESTLFSEILYESLFFLHQVQNLPQNNGFHPLNLYGLLRFCMKDFFF